MAHFYPGPSKVYPEVATFLQDAYATGVLSWQHRSPAFVQMVEEIQENLKEKFNLPQEYTVLFVSSATEAWEVISRAYAALPALHIFNGSFGEKWYNYAKVIRTTPPQALKFSEDHLAPLPKGVESLCAITHNETSNATAWPNTHLEKLREAISGLIAVDATSSLGAVDLPWKAADIWLCSVQKALGLPAGLGLLIVNARAMQLARHSESKLFYNSLSFLGEKMKSFQTTYTPNVLGIYLLHRLLQKLPNIREVSAQNEKNYRELLSFFQDKGYKHIVNNPKARSQTTLAFTLEEAELAQLFKAATAAGITLGKGYGLWKSSTFRIANFPQHSQEDREKLYAFFNGLQG